MSNLASVICVFAQEAERPLVGAQASEQTFRRAPEAVMQGARGLEHNRFKIEMGGRVLVALTVAAAVIANAVFHASGRRIRDLPMTPEDDRGG